MNIVHVEDFFHPSAGYQINVLAKYMQAMGHNITIVTAELDIIPDYLLSFFGKDNIKDKDAEYSNKYGVNIIRIPGKKYISGRVIFGNNLVLEIKKLNPDIVFAHGNDTVSCIQMINYCCRRKIPIVTDSHMLEMASTNRFSKIFRFVYKNSVAKKINRKKIKVIRTQDSDYTNRLLGIKEELTPYIPLGSDLMMFYPDKAVKQLTRDELKINQDDFVVIYAGKIDKAKGGLFLAQALKDRMITSKSISFLLVGNPSGEDKEVIENTLKKSLNHIVRVGTQPYVNLAKYYQTADLAIFPKQCSLSFYDVQATGLPVVFEDNEINIKRSQNHNAITFKKNDIEDFRDKMEIFINMEDEEFTEYKNNSISFIRENFNYENVAKMYLDIIEKEYAKKLK